MASVNAFRTFFNLTTFVTFEAINPDPVVANDLRTRYQTLNYVVRYPGLLTKAIGTRMDPAVGIFQNDFCNENVCILI